MPTAKQRLLGNNNRQTWQPPFLRSCPSVKTRRLYSIAWGYLYFQSSNTVYRFLIMEKKWLTQDRWATVFKWFNARLFIVLAFVVRIVSQILLLMIVCAVVFALNGNRMMKCQCYYGAGVILLLVFVADLWRKWCEKS